jgi:quercetin dioxygenase-like cupin family protein
MKFWTMMALAALLAGSPAYCLEPGSGVRVDTGLKTDSSWDGGNIAYPGGEAEVTGLVIEVDPGMETGWHRHAVPSFAYILSGELEVRTEGGARKLLKSGDMLAEVVGVVHNGQNVGTEPVKLVVFYTGAKGVPLSEKVAR